ncbi:Transposable element P transposase [Armadillidium vulgare]|nr:Transposable element P transposase [Armadillidium vulgare]
MYKNYKKKCCDPLKRHKKPILSSLVPITPFIEGKFNLSKNNFICSNCLYNHCSKKKLESHEELQDQKDRSSDNLYYNQGTSSISTRNQVSDKSTQCSKTPILKNASTQCGIFKKNVATQCYVNTSNTPRKQRLRKELHRKKAHIRYLKKKSAFLKLKLAAMKKVRKRKMTKDDVIKYCTKKLPLLSLEVFKSNILQKQHYTESCKSISLSIYLKSPRAYRYLRKVLKLPSVDTLKRYLNRVSIGPGLSNQLLMNFSNVTSKLKEIDKIVVLMIDEMNIKKNLQFNSKRQLIWGLEDFGEGKRRPQPASSALCFMVRSITSNWRQLVGYVFSGGPSKVNMMKHLIFKCISELTDIGLHVVCITTDQASNFSLLFKQLGVSKMEPFFHFKKKKIVVIPDVPHLLKSTRNAIYNNHVKIREGIVQWEYIREAYKTKLKSNFPFIPKVTKAHIYLPPFGGKMKVKYASQILSRSFHVALTQMRLEHKVDDNSEATAEFCLKVNNLFDILNSSPSQRNRSPFHEELRRDSVGWNYLTDMVCWVQEWKIYRDIEGQREVTAHFKFKDGWIQAINGVKMLLQELNANFKLKSVYTRRLCQDPIENCFGNIRGACGFNDNPTCSMFEAVFQRAAVSSLLNMSRFKNCENDDTYNIFLQGPISCDSISKVSETDEVSNLKEISFAKLVLFPSLTDIRNDELNGMRYVCGLLAVKVIKFHGGRHCSKCNLTSLINTEDMNNTFMMLKQFDHLQNNEGLTNCSDNFFIYFIGCEKIFCREFSKMYFRENIVQYISNKIMCGMKYTFCSSEVELFTVKKFITLRIYYCIKFYNNSDHSKSQNSFNKLKKLKHL